MNKILSETKDDFHKTTILVRKTLYKTIEFQLLFKIFYISILLFLVNFLMSVFLDALNLLIAKIQIDEAIDSIPFVSLFDFKVMTVLILSLLAFIYVYLIEKNGIIIITSKYYRNNFTSFFKTLFLSIQKTPRFIARRIYEMRIVILLFIALYIMWKALSSFALSEWIASLFGWILLFYGTWIFFSVLFRYTFTAYTTCLYPKESYTEFNAKLPEKFLRKRTRVNIVFYTMFILVAFLWLIIFSLISQTLLYFLEANSSMISALLAFFISFTIVSILVVLSFMKTFKVSLMTTLYYEERKQQKRKIIKYSKEKQPLLSKNIYLALSVILAIIIISGAFLTTTIKTKTDHVIHNASEYIEQITENGEISNINNIEQIRDMKPRELITTMLSQETSAIGTIEKFVFALLAYLIVR